MWKIFCVDYIFVKKKARDFIWMFPWIFPLILYQCKASKSLISNSNNTKMVAIVQWWHAGLRMECQVIDIALRQVL